MTKIPSTEENLQQKDWKRKEHKPTSVSVIQSKSDWNDVVGTVHKQIPTNLSELKQHCKENWIKSLLK